MHQSTFIIQPQPPPVAPLGTELFPIVSQSVVTLDYDVPEKIRKVYLAKAKITIISPAGRDLSFLKSLHTYIVADGHTDKLLAFRDTITNHTGNVLILNTSAENFREYLLHGRYSLRIRTAVGKALREEVKMDIDLEFKVLAEIWGN